MTQPWPPQLVQECNASVQSMKRTEELIHLSKKIHFEGKVHARSGWNGHTKGSSRPLLPWGLQASSSLPPPPILGLCSPPCFSGPDLSSLLPPFSQIFPLISQARWLVRHGELVELAPLPAAPPAKLKLSSKAVYLHLFNDCLLLSRRKE